MTDSNKNDRSTHSGTVQIESDYFDRLVVESGGFNPFSDSGWETLRRRWLRDCCVSGCRLRILDVGCGAGESLRIYAPEAREYVGIDLSRAALMVASRRFPDQKWVRADACRLPFVDQSFDAVAFSSVLHHIPNRERALSEAYRVLRPGGRVFAFDPNLRHPAMLLFRWPKSPLYNPNGVSPNESPLLGEELRRSFADTGFVELRQRAQSDIAYRHVDPGWMSRALNLYNRVDSLWERAGLGRTFGVFLVTSARRPD